MYPEDDPDHKFELPASPWTYENGTLNPGLHPTTTTTRRRTAARTKAAEGPYASVPPYHPDYHRQDSHETYPVDSQSEDDAADGDKYAHQGRPREFIRRGSEGYEVRQINREELLQRYVEDRTTQPGRYQLYVPEASSEPESGSEASDEQIPLGEKLERWRATSV